MAYLSTLVLSFLTLLTTYIITSKLHRHLTILRFKSQHACLPPLLFPNSGLLGWRIVHELWTSHRLHDSLEKHTLHHRTLGPTWEIRFLHVDLVMTIDPDNIKALLSTQFADFSLGARLPAFAPLLTGGIFVSDGPAWMHSRALVRPAFTRAQVADLGRFERHVARLVGRIPRDGTTTVDLMPLFYRLTLDQATEFLLGESVGSLVSAPDSEQQRFGAAFDYVQRQLGGWNTAGWGAWVWPNRKCEREVKVVHAFVDGFVERARRKRRAAALGDERGEGREMEGENEKEKWGGEEKEEEEEEEEEKTGRYVFLDELAKATDNPTEMRNEILSILIAGRDTTASMLTSTFHALSLRPDIWARLRAEVAFLNGQPPDYETLRNLKYVKHVMNEVLRLYPAVPANSRQAVLDTTLPRGGGPDGLSPIFITKGQVVGYSPWSMHRLHPSFGPGPDGDAFRPERWERLRVGWEFLPFNGGPRICVGQQFALVTWSYAIVRVVQAFGTVESRDSEPWTEDVSVTVGSRNGAKVVFGV